VDSVFGTFHSDKQPEKASYKTRNGNGETETKQKEMKQNERNRKLHPKY